MITQHRRRHDDKRLDNLHAQPGLLEHLAAHSIVRGLAASHPATGKTPRKTWMEYVFDQQQTTCRVKNGANRANSYVWLDHTIGCLCHIARPRYAPDQVRNRSLIHAAKSP